MTENEAIKGLETLKYQCKHNGECGTCNICCSAIPLAIQALEELQQYRAIGLTPKMVKEMIESEKLASHQAIIRGVKLEQYEAIGTIEEFKALKEKDTPKKPIIKEWCPAICPNCKQNLSESRGDGYWVHYTSLERCDCGQKLDWE